MTNSELINLLNELISHPAESEWIEFKTKKHGVSDEQIGEYISAMSNGATIKRKPFGYLVFGVEDKTHVLKGTDFTFVGAIHGGNQDLELFLRINIQPKINFEIFEFDYQNKHFVLIRIPSAKGEPTNFQKKPYIRIGSNKTDLRNFPELMRIVYNSQNDWSAKVVAGATIDHLDKDAILKAREKYKERNRPLADDVDNWNDITFLNKAKVTIDGEITNTAILLLGKAESDHLISPAIAHITWVLKDAPGGFEHFNTPFILTAENVLDGIRNLRYSYMIGDSSLFPKEVLHYDKWVIRELLHNCIAHQDYSQSSRIIIQEFNSRLIFQNAGGFIPNSVEEVIHYNSPQKYFRNPFLANAMVSLNMIETVGNGIQKIFSIQRDRFFPMPTYDISEENSTTVTLYGELINQNYTNILSTNPDLSIDDVIALDKVQKKLPLSEVELQRLRELKLVKGKSTMLEIAGATNSLNNKDYKQMILNLITEKGSVQREDVEKLLMPILPQDWTITQQRKKISNLLTILSSKDGKIKNISQSDRYPIYEIKS